MSDIEKIPQEFFEDKAGQKVVRGDYIVYGHNLGRCAGLRFGKVLDIYLARRTWGRVEDSWRIVIRGVDDDWGSREPQLLAKKSFLQFPDRIMKVNELFPEKYRKLLKDV